MVDLVQSSAIKNPLSCVLNKFVTNREIKREKRKWAHFEGRRETDLIKLHNLNQSCILSPLGGVKLKFYHFIDNQA
jgi:hypothetical protein